MLRSCFSARALQVALLVGLWPYSGHYRAIVLFVVSPFIVPVAAVGLSLPRGSLEAVSEK